MKLNTSINSPSAVPVPNVVEVNKPTAPTTGATPAPEKPTESPAMAERKQNMKRASVTMTAEQVKANIDAAVEKLNKLSINSGRGLQFNADNKLGRQTITVTNTETGEVVRTIPTDIAILAANGGVDIKGLLHDKVI